MDKEYWIKIVLGSLCAVFYTNASGEDIIVYEGDLRSCESWIIKNEKR